MKVTLLQVINRVLHPLSLALTSRHEAATSEAPYDFSQLEKTILSQVRPFTMTSPERVAVLVEAVRHIVTQGIRGDFVECGVWKGGSAMAAALALQASGDTGRDLWLYDTYEGMSEPTPNDVSYDGASAAEQLQHQDIQDPRSVWCYSPLEEVQANVKSTRYPEDRLHYVKGRVEDTLPNTLPDRIALLRLDTDWYESTRHELIHLYPRLASGGILIVDDYGYWQGSRRAVDEYFDEHGPRPMLVRIDATARIAVKP